MPHDVLNGAVIVLTDGITFTVKNTSGELDGYYADNIDSCKGDFNIDGDIDGNDLFKLIPSLGETGLSEFAGNFGNTDCLNEG